MVKKLFLDQSINGKKRDNKAFFFTLQAQLQKIWHAIANHLLVVHETNGNMNTEQHKQTQI